MEQILEHLLAKMNAMQERTDASLREMRSEIRTNREEIKTKKYGSQPKKYGGQDVWLEERKASLRKTEARKESKLKLSLVKN
jgi:hypothetical protein